MTKVSGIGVKYRGGFRGPYISIAQLIENKVEMDIRDFATESSCVRDCENYTKMQIRINGKLYVTWHSSAVLANFLSDCRAKEAEDGEAIFPIEQCNIIIGDDRSYYLVDSQGSDLTDKDMERMVNKARNKSNKWR